MSARTIGRWLSATSLPLPAVLAAEHAATLVLPAEVAVPATVARVVRSHVAACK